MTMNIMAINTPFCKHDEAMHDEDLDVAIDAKPVWLVGEVGLAISLSSMLLLDWEDCVAVSVAASFSFCTSLCACTALLADTVAAGPFAIVAVTAPDAEAAGKAGCEEACFVTTANVCIEETAIAVILVKIDGGS